MINVTFAAGGKVTPFFAALALLAVFSLAPAVGPGYAKDSAPAGAGRFTVAQPETLTPERPGRPPVDAAAPLLTHTATFALG
jgi:hypothetical protein